MKDEKRADFLMRVIYENYVEKISKIKKNKELYIKNNNFGRNEIYCNVCGKNFLSLEKLTKLIFLPVTLLMLKKQ